VVKVKEYVLTKGNGKKVYKTRKISKPHGKWIYYGPDGRVLTEMKYKKGVKQ
jgi:antitoxin component YwqK of YwqJK toxin-antitoxin module